jgi:hypothetical protein
MDVCLAKGLHPLVSLASGNQCVDGLVPMNLVEHAIAYTFVPCEHIIEYVGPLVLLFITAGEQYLQ